MEVTVVLDAEQTAVVGLPAETSAFVEAGPGAGKSETLVHRVRAMASSDEDRPPTRVLVLTFTRAVTTELAKRFRHLDLEAYVRVSTIDAFARSVVMDREGEAPATFDAVITRAVELIDVDSGFRPGIVVVDEAQDLVGPRLALIAAVLRRSDGFTVFGDTAQGIYGHQGSSSSSVEDAMEVLRAREPEAVLLELVGEYRSRSPEVTVVHWAQRALRTRSDETAYAGVFDTLNGLRSLPLERASGVLRRAGAEAAVLCRTNGEVLALSALLWSEQIAHRINHGSGIASPPAWVAGALRNSESDLVSERDFFGSDSAESDVAVSSWRELRRIASDGQASVSVSKVRERLDLLSVSRTEGDLPLLTTVHRAKGLEFERVIILEPARGAPIELHEARIAFVALTRARERLLRLERPTFPNLRKRQGTGRWTIQPWRRSGTLAFELRVGDVDRSSVPWTDGEGDTPRRAQGVLAAAKPGSAVELEDSGTGYTISLDGTVVGRTGSSFEDALLWSGVTRVGNRPTRIRGRLESVSTMASRPDITERLGLGRSGLLLCPEIAGFGELDWT